MPARPVRRKAIPGAHGLLLGAAQSLAGHEQDQRGEDDNGG